MNMTINGMVIALYIFALLDLNEALREARRKELEAQEKDRRNQRLLFEQTAEALVSAIEAKDKYTHGHSARVARYSTLIAQEVGKTEEECRTLYYVALLHDVGKIGISDEIINKVGKLTDEEFAMIKRHPVFGNNILSRIKQMPYLSIGAHYHHERYDGRGYPEGLKGEDIPEIARIIAVADAYDAMTSKRSYRNSVPQHVVREELVKGTGAQFDPKFAAAMIRLVDRDVAYSMQDRYDGVDAPIENAKLDTREFRESSGRLSAATMDRVSGALTYRVFGCEPQRDRDYEAHLSDYEKKAVLANIWAGSMPPLYNVISMSSVLFIFWFGTRNVAGTGWTAWDIAAFTTFLSCYTKLSVKSSHAAKLFNAVQKAEVSWRRIVPLMKRPPEESAQPAAAPALLTVKDLGFSYPQNPDHPIFSGISFTAAPGTIIGVTGPVASGKSTFGRAFLCEQPYKGSIRFAGEELSALPDAVRQAIIGYLGHDPELMSGTIREDVLMGTPDSPSGGSSSLLGIGLLVLGGVFWALYNYMVQAISDELDAFTISWYQTLWAALFYLPFLFLEKGGMPALDMTSILCILYLGAGCSTLAYILYNAGLRGVSAFAAATLLNLMPLSGTVLSALILHETISLRSWLGGALIIAGVVIANRRK